MRLRQRARLFSCLVTVRLRELLTSRTPEAGFRGGAWGVRAGVRQHRPLSEHAPPKVQRIWLVRGGDGPFGRMRSSQVTVRAPHPPPPSRPLLTTDQAAEYLNVPARWVADAVRQRRVRCTRIGKHVRFRLEHLDELVTAGEQPVTSEVIPIQGSRTRSKL